MPSEREKAITFVNLSIDKKLLQAHSCLDFKKVAALSLIKYTLQTLD